MTDKKLMNDIEEAKTNRQFPILGLLVALVSITHGEFIIRVEGYFLMHAEPYLQGLPEDVIGAALLILGVIKLIAIVLKNAKLKRVGIVGLSTIWWGLTAVAITYSFGTGFPHPSWQFFLFIAAICIVESRRGDYRD